jgi:pyruvate formate lyase activating enzyme
MKAYLWDPEKDLCVKCNLCNHRCLIKDGKRGICNVRENRSGTLETLVYGKLVARNIDPIEKKPLFHFMPGSRSYSIATVGCNFKCRFCQNADIAQLPSDRGGMIIGDTVSPDDIVSDAKRTGCKSISYTYTEPTIYFEYAHDTARLARQAGIRNVFVTNGYMAAEALDMMHPYLDAANVDLKAFNDDFYRKLCGAKLEPVKDTLARMKSLGIFVEVTTLLIPGLNDDPGELSSLARFLVDVMGPETPWHVSRFHPTYRLTDTPATPLHSLLTAREIGINAGLRYVYTGNVPGERGEDTHCHNCGNTVIERTGFSIRSYKIKNGRCENCGIPVDGVEM